MAPGHLPASGAGDGDHGAQLALTGVESDWLGRREAGALQAGDDHPDTVDQALLGLTPVLPAVLQPGVDNAQSVVRVPLARPHHPPSRVGPLGVRPAPGGVTQPPLLREDR